MRPVPESPELIAGSPSAEDCCGGAPECLGEAATKSALSATTSRESCPPPLQWQEVLAAYREQSAAWRADTVAGPIAGRVWGEGPTLVLLNGLGGTHELFALLAYLLKAHCRCVTLDYPSGRPLNWRRLTTAIAEVTDEFAGAEGCHLFGASFGSAVALEIALRLEGRIRSLTLVSAFAQLRLTVFERAAAAALGWLPLRLRSVPLWRAIQERAHRLWFPPIDSTRWQFYMDNAGQTPVAEIARRFSLLGQFKVRSRLTSLTSPTLLLHVEGEGALQSRCRDELASLLPNARTEYLPSTGMLVFLTHPHRLAKAIRAFVCPSGLEPQ